jgi:uncharacterized membrane protein
MQTGQVDIGQAFSWTFKKLGQYPAPLLLLALPIVVLGIIRYFVNDAIVNSLDKCRVTDGFQVDCGMGIGKTIGVAIGVGLVFGILIYIAQIGIYRAALKTTRGEVPDFGMITSGENLGPYIVTSIVTGICIFVGVAACILPGLIAAFFLAFAPMASLDRGVGVGEAFSTSIDIAKRNVGPIIVLAIVIIVASFLGNLLFGVLWIITLPIQALLVANVYRQGLGEPVAP